MRVAATAVLCPVLVCLLSSCGGELPVTVAGPSPAPATSQPLAQAQLPEPSPPPPPPTSTEGLLVGTYAMTLEIGRSCSVLPDADRIRSYSSSIDVRGTEHQVSLGSATFLSGPICTAGG